MIGLNKKLTSKILYAFFSSPIIIVGFFFSVAPYTHKTGCPGEDQPQVHRHKFQVWSWTFPDRCRQGIVHGPVEERPNPRRIGSGIGCRRHFKWSCSRRSVIFILCMLIKEIFLKTIINLFI